MKDHVDRTLERAGIPQTDSSTIEVLSRLVRVVAFVEKGLGEAYGSVGLHRGEVDVLSALLRAGTEPQSPTRIATSLMCSSGAMTNRLDGLEKAGLIRREHAKDDRRAILLSLTKKGREVTQQANAARESISAKLLPGLSVKDRKVLVGILRQMLVQFEASSENVA